VDKSAPPLLPVLTGCNAVATTTTADTDTTGSTLATKPLEVTGVRVPTSATSLRLTFGGLGAAELAPPTFSPKWFVIFSCFG
jgi:hypothetical protein